MPTTSLTGSMVSVGVTRASLSANWPSVVVPLSKKPARRLSTRTGMMVAMTSLSITGVDFVTVPAQDIEESERFYGETLGLPFVKRWGNMPGVEFQAGNLTIAVMDPTAFGQEFRPHGVPLAFQVDDVAAAKAQLEEKGVTFLGDIIDSGVCHQAIFRDPAGNTLDLH